ncbi:hypothetical protein [uncultured Thiodictyon sp.]|uniref:hypothetical protein n=1 Tax=uncultured Thiodictyon sp. TaxID=1846217 RepID=UPI0025F176BB|nr:hypothetical protein [uncultured Thiodictyon sp.]
MNVNESTCSSDQKLPASGRLRRRFLGGCASLLGAWGLAAATVGRQSAPAAGPRERALCAADFYRPHHLAG